LPGGLPPGKAHTQEKIKMRVYSKWATVMLLATGLAMGSMAVYAADSHSDGGHSDGHSGGKGKGPKYMGGDRGTSHSSSSHKGGSSHHDSSEGGSKSVEDKIFHGKSGGGHETSSEGEEATGHSH
jgi:hypothetical protein